ncbi:hypothetical protein VUR80DRAFT_3090 [Thermomyces stellatus]
MDEIRETIERIQAALRPHLGSREHVEQVRRLLSQHLQESLANSLPGRPLSIVDGTLKVDLRGGATAGQEREYLEAVERYASAAAEFRKVQNAESTQAAGASGETASWQQLDDHIHAVRLRCKKSDLEFIHKYIDSVSEQPMTKNAALDLKSVLEEATPLPEVPSKIVDSLASADNNGSADVDDFMDKLDMILLKSKLLLKRESELLERAKADSSTAPGSLSDGAKARALDATRTELINWIEEELGKASSEGDTTAEADEPEDDQTEDTGASQKEEQRQKEVKKQLEKDLSGIEAKYARYVSSRKSLIEALGRSRSLISKTIRENPPSQEVAALVEEHPPNTYLQIPLMENALNSLLEQRGHITHKSFLNVSLGKQLKDASLAIEHLAEESQLLPDHPIPTSQEAAKNSTDPLSAASSEKPDFTGKIKPWAYASESSKIATFESIAEKIEEAQMAMEDTIGTLTKADKLLGKDAQEGPRADENEGDIWLENEGSGSKGGSKRRAGNGKADGHAAGDIFSSLKVDLGLIGREHLD